MKKLIISFLILFSFCSLAQSEYRTHTVQEGETLYRISKRYEVSQDDIIKLNPDVKDGVQVGDLLVIPKVNRDDNPSVVENVDVRRDTNIIIHHVQPKETLYGLAKQYGVSIDDILEANPDLRDGLKIGGLVYIPKNKMRSVELEVNLIPEEGFQIIQVTPKETVYNICRTYGLTEREFYNLNPHIEQLGLQIGQQIKVPLVLDESEIDVSHETDTAKTNENNSYYLYQVGPNETIASLSQKFVMTQEELLKINPELNDGIEEGQYIILPQRTKSRINSEVSLSKDWISSFELNKSKLKISLILPFYLPINDSIEMSSGYGSNAEIYQRSKTAIEFYNGFSLAMDTLLYYGVDIELQVIDSENSIQELQKQKAKIKNFEPDFIVGPLYAQSASWMAKNFNEVPVVSPLSRATNNWKINNLINCYTDETGELLGLIDLINENYLDAQLVFINPDSSVNRESVNFIKQNLMSTSTPDFEEVWLVDDYLERNAYLNYKNIDKQTVWVTTSKDPAFLNDFLTKMYSLNDSDMIILGLSKITELKTIENHYLSNLTFWNTQRDFIDYSSLKTEDFIYRYRKQTNTEPSEVAFKAYDAGIYFGFIAARFGSLPLDRSWPEYQGLNSGYLFRHSFESGPQNHFIYILGIENYVKVRF